MRWTTGLLAALLLLGSSGMAVADGHGSRPVLVELFTSQGCSSCPPADALAGELSTRDDVVILSFHVSYWDYIGWKDPFATAETTQRQYDYAEALRQRNVYTPQMVIGGQEHVVGSDVATVLRTVEQVGKGSPRAPQIAIARVGERFRVSLGSAHHEGDADVLLVRYDSRHDTSVSRGENRGRTMTNYNVVRDFRKIGTWNGEQSQIMLNDADLVGAHGQDGCAVIIQEPNTGPVVAVANFDMIAIQR
jgi:hypothetical protein